MNIINRRGRRGWVGAAAPILVASALALSACGSGSGSTTNGAPRPGGKKITTGAITIGTTFAPTTLDPGTGTSGADYQYLDFVFDRLINFNEKTGNLQPMLATSWSFRGANKLTLDVKLRHGVKFSDGTPFNAQAVVTYSKAYIKDGDVLDNLQYVTKISAVNNYEVRYTLSQQNSQLPYGLADRAGMIPSPTAVAKEGKGFGVAPVGAGPYKFVSENAGSSYSFTRNDAYWNNANQPRVKKINFQVFATDTALVSAVRSGSVNMAGALFPQDVQVLKSDANVTTSIDPGTGFDVVYFNGKLKPLTNPKVRLAFNLALNRTAIMNAATNGLGKVWTQPVAPGTYGYSKGEAPVWTYNVAKAKQLMAQAGYAKGVNMTCYTYPGEGFNITAPVIISEEKAIGININVVTGTPAQVVPYYTKNLAPCYLSGFLGGANPVTTYEGLLWSKSYYNAGKTNFGVDRYIDKFFTTYTKANYQALFDHINKVMKTSPGYAVLYANPDINVYQKNIAGWVISPFELENWQGLYFTS